MKETKFRAWDKEKKRMYADVGIFPFPWNERTQNNSWSFSADGTTVNPYHKNIALMQYIGLKDKNGKEVYEGDIALTRRYIVENGKQKRPEKKFVVVDSIQSWHTVLCLSSDNNIEIIGNIHENPELLEATDE